MKKIFKLFRLVIPYWQQATFSILSNLLSIVFSVFSVTMAIPFLGILFDNQNLVTTGVPFAFSYDSLEHNFNYWLSQIIVDYGKPAALMYISMLVVSMVFFKTLFAYLADYFISPLRNGIVRDLRNKLFDKILTLQLGYFSEEKKGDLISRITTDVNEIEVSIIRSLNSVFKEPMSIIIYLGTLIFMSPQLTLFVFFMLPITGGIIGRIAKNLRKNSADAQKRHGFILSLIEETLGALRVIKVFNSEKRVADRFENENQGYTNVMVKMSRRKDLASPLSEFLGTLVVVSIMWYGGQMILNGTSSLTSQAFIGYLMVFYLIINPVKAFSSVYYNIQKGLASVDRVNAVLDTPVTIFDSADAAPVHEFNHKIEYKNVSFKYQKDYVLKDINLTIEKGKTIALVGQSGSGKSTMVDLLPRIYDITEGEILIDGVNIKSLKLKDLRSLMGNVNQESILFNDTIRNNIAFGVDNATDEAIEHAARIANAHDFIMETPNGYNTNIGDRGSKLSGGQKQRLSIARAVLKNPPIMILDEATSALDTESEKLVQDALYKLMANRTSIVIAHRLSTVKHADEICVMHEGRIVERGKHDQLLALNGIYTKLHNLQMFA